MVGATLPSLGLPERLTESPAQHLASGFSFPPRAHPQSVDREKLGKRTGRHLASFLSLHHYHSVVALNSHIALSSFHSGRSGRGSPAQCHSPTCSSTCGAWGPLPGSRGWWQVSVELLVACFFQAGRRISLTSRSSLKGLI